MVFDIISKKLDGGTYIAIGPPISLNYRDFKRILYLSLKEGLFWLFYFQNEWSFKGICKLSMVRTNI